MYGKGRIRHRKIKLNNRHPYIGFFGREYSGYNCYILKNFCEMGMPVVHWEKEKENGYFLKRTKKSCMLIKKYELYSIKKIGNQKSFMAWTDMNNRKRIFKKINSTGAGKMHLKEKVPGERVLEEELLHSWQKYSETLGAEISLLPVTCNNKEKTSSMLRCLGWLIIMCRDKHSGV